jgi:DNA-binding NtrC family response regulator
MQEPKIRALLVRAHANDLNPLAQILDQLVTVSDVRTCEAAESDLQKPNPPHLVFTDTELPDGTWDQVLSLAMRAAKPVNVIVIARSPEVSLYIEAMEAGAFDLVAASSRVAEVAHVVRNAAENVLKRRQAQDRLRPGSGAGKPLRSSRSV